MTRLARLVLAGAALGLVQCAHGGPPAYLPVPPAPTVVAVAKKVCTNADADEAWLRCLEDPAQRGGAVTHLLDSLDEDELAVGAPLFEALLRVATGDPSNGRLNEALFDTNDPRALTVATAVLDAYPRSRDSRVTSRAISFVVARSREAPLDDAAATALWSAFLRHHPPETADADLGAEFYEAILTIQHPTWATKAVDVLHRPTRSSMTAAAIEVDLWQRTAIELLGLLRFAPAVHLLVATVMNKSVPSLQGVAERALIRMPREVVPMVVTAIASPDSTFAELESAWGPSRGFVSPLLYTLMFVGTNEAKAALLGLVPKMLSTENRAAMAMALLWMPWDAHLFQVVKELFGALPPLEGEVDGPGSPRLQILRTMGNSEDPSVIPWLLAEAEKAKGPVGVTALSVAIDRSIPLMQPEHVALVGKALPTLEARVRLGGDAAATEDAARLRTDFNAASALVRKCAKDVRCYLGALDEATPVTTDASRWKAVKAAAMCGLLGDGATREALLERIPKVRDSQARYYLTLAVDHLAPTGDMHAAEVFEALVRHEPTTATAELGSSHTLLEEVAYRLRARLMAH